MVKFGTTSWSEFLSWRRASGNLKPATKNIFVYFTTRTSIVIFIDVFETSMECLYPSIPWTDEFKV